MMSNDIENTVKELEDKLNQANQQSFHERFKLIDKFLLTSELNTDKLTENESIYVHSKLHFYYHMKHPPISHNNIIKIHFELKNNLKPHIDFDILDTIS